MQPRPQADDLFVAPNGRDTWTGRLPRPNRDGTDGPLASLAAARDLLRERRAKAQYRGPVTVWLRGGRYRLERPLVFGPGDSGPVTFAPYPGERAVLEGGVRIQNWRQRRLRGRTAWVADVSALLRDHPGGFRQLFVNGQRRPRARLPKRGYYWIEEVPGVPLDAPFDRGTDHFRAARGDFRLWRNLEDVEVVVLHFWTEERMPVAAYDPETRLVRSTRQSVYTLVDDIGGRYAKYYVENVWEGLSAPGEWYLDRKAAELYYLPERGETPDNTEVVAPVLLQFVRFEGQPAEERFVEFITLRDLVFEYADWIQPRGWGVRFDPLLPDAAQKPLDQYPMFDRELPRNVQLASGGQAAHNVPGAIVFVGARYCGVEDCRVEHIGWYAVEVAEGCRGVRIVGNTLADLGGGGVKVNGSFRPETWRERTSNILITDNHIDHAGEVFLGSCGILLQHTFGNLVAHNHIHDLYYTGISCGFVWGYGENVSRENRIENNHIHHLGKGVLSDMGGIYVLGVQPGTTIRGNLIHDIERCNYGGWGIYPDEGSSHLVIEHNICHDVSSQTFHQHFGRENIVRNNIFAFGAEGLAALSRGNRMNRRFVHCGTNIRCAITFERNIFASQGEPVFVGALADETGWLENGDFHSDLNLFWDYSGQGVVSGNGVHGKRGRENLTRAFTWAEWQALGYDRHSIVADPCFRDVEKRDFRLAKNSPALALGFQPIDMSRVGPRPKQERVDEPEYQLRRWDI